MTAGELARSHFRAALVQGEVLGLDPDAIARSMLSLAISAFLERRTLSDVRTELLAAADNIDPDTDYMFMRP